MCRQPSLLIDYQRSTSSIGGPSRSLLTYPEFRAGVPLLLKQVAPSGWRYICAIIDPPSAIYAWRALGELTFGEKAMDLLTLFPDEMDIGRALDRYFREGGNDKLDRYFPPRTTGARRESQFA